MSLSKGGDASTWVSKRTIQPNTCFSVANTPFKLDKGLVAKKSAKIAALLEENPHEELTTFFQHIKTDPETLELIARFCHGFEVHMSTDNIVSLICLSHHLKMTETHCPNNLLDKALLFLEQRILNSWDESIRSLRVSSTHVLEQAIHIGLIHNYLSAIVGHVVGNPSLLGQPVESNKPVIRRKLFDCDRGCASSEDLSCLPLRVYELIINAIAQHKVPKEYITGSLFRHLKTHQSDKQVIEVVERLLPTENHINTSLLLGLYATSLSLQPDPETITRLEIRVGKQLDQISLSDLHALDLGIENLRHILKGFYGNYSADTNAGLVKVAELMEQYLIEIAKEPELEPGIFTQIAEMVTSAISVRNFRFTDGIYRAVDVYLDKHRELSETEKEGISKVIDFEKMSKEACGHATQNQRLPLRVVVQALFVSQLKLQDEISKVVGGSCGNSNAEEEEEEIRGVAAEEEEEEEEGRGGIIGGGFESSCGCGRRGREKKGSLWKEVKRKFGCVSSRDGYESLCDCNKFQVKKRKKLHLK